MKSLLRILPVLAVAAFLAGCEGPCQKTDILAGPDRTNGSADFSVVGALGANLSAGFQSGGVASRHQLRSFPALFAQHVGMTAVATGQAGFTFNGINNDGYSDILPGHCLLAIQSLSPLVISNAGRTPGAPENSAQAADFHNLAVPGLLAADLVDSTLYTVDPNPVRGAGYDKYYFNTMLRGRGLPVQQMARRAPTFFTFEFGTSEVLGAVKAGSAGVFPSASYVLAVRSALNSLHAALPNAKAAVFNVPNVTRLPYCTTFPAVTMSTITNTPVALIGPNGPLSPTDLVLLSAQGSLVTGRGFPVGAVNYLNPAAPGNGLPLLDSDVLSDNEQDAIRLAVFNMNAALDSITANRPWTAKVDLNALYDDFTTNGFKLGATEYTTDFVTGGLFSLDGLLPNDLTHAIICNQMIDAVNAQFGATIPRLNVANYGTATSSSLTPVADGASVLPVRVAGLESRLRALRSARH